jgi:hypothetical protein
MGIFYFNFILLKKAMIGLNCLKKGERIMKKKIFDKNNKKTNQKPLNCVQNQIINIKDIHKRKNHHNKGLSNR